jgi:hypothetical protein
MTLSVSGFSPAASYSSPATHTAPSPAMSRNDLTAALNDALPGLSVAYGRLPSDPKQQEKLARSGQLAAITIEPKAAERLQSDPDYRAATIDAIKKDHEEWGPGTIHDMGQSQSEVVAHGISINDDGSMSSWTFSKTHSGGKDDKSLIDKIKDKLKEQQKKDKISAERHEAALKEADTMRAAGKSEEEIAAKLREAYVATLAPGDSASVGVDVRA